MAAQPQGAHTPFIAIAGNIGVGKSTLTGLLARSLGYRPFYEASADNPYLADFYRDMRGWSFHSQVYFLGRRLEHHRQLLDAGEPAIQDRTVYEDAEIFAANLREQDMMSARDYEAYHRLYLAVRAFLPPPDLIVYLEAPLATLQERIASRGRDYERSIAPAYLRQLNALYERWAAGWRHCPLLRVPVAGQDFRDRPADYANLLSRIQMALAE